MRIHTVYVADIHFVLPLIFIHYYCFIIHDVGLTTQPPRQMVVRHRSLALAILRAVQPSLVYIVKYEVDLFILPPPSLLSAYEATRTCPTVGDLGNTTNQAG